MEYLDIVDENNNLTGEVVERDIVHKEGLCHREVAVWVVNEQGEILVQKRSATKKFLANRWGACAGHVSSGDDIENAAKRELFEEIGLDRERLEFMFVAKVEDERNNAVINNMFQYMYFLKTNTEIADYKIQYEELSEVKYINIEELQRIVNEKDENYTFAKRKYMPKVIEEIKKRIIKN